MAYLVFKNKILTHNMLLYLRGILVTLVILFATLFTNFWFTTLASPYNIKSNSSGNMHSSNSTVGPSDHDNDNLLILHNITNSVSFTGEVDVNNLPSLHHQNLV